MESWKSALFAIVRTTLITPPPFWGLQSYYGLAPEGVARPYTVYLLAGGGEVNHLRKDDINALMMIKGVADDLEQAVAMEAEIAARFNNKGFQDVAAGYLFGGPDWDISTSTRELSIEYVENIENARQVYHSGAQYRFIMQAK